MQIIRPNAQPATKGSADTFTGDVSIASPFKGNGDARIGGAVVTFAPAARSHWHTHPLGQILIVTAGTGWTQCDGGPIEEIRAGDILWCPPGHRHWHGATPTTSMTHVAVQEALNGVAVHWLEAVTDAQYLAGPGH